jgi:hypothetical protein
MTYLSSLKVARLVLVGGPGGGLSPLECIEVCCIDLSVLTAKHASDGWRGAGENRNTKRQGLWFVVELRNINTQDALGTLAQIVHVEAGAQTGSTNSCSGRDSCSSSSSSNNGYNVVREESRQPHPLWVALYFSFNNNIPK